MPEIIEFCNQMWYQPNGYSLYPLRQYSENRLEPIVTEFVENGFVEGTRSTIINKNEADRLIQTLIRCLSDPRYQDKTFGVITLQGSAQSKYIEKEILEKVDPIEIENRKIICGISSDFQGDERDVILLSLVTSREHNRAPFTKPEDERRFNVAVSRAKDQLMLFHSVQPEDLNNTDDLRYKLLLYMLNTKNKVILDEVDLAKPFESKFEQDIYQAIKAKGYQVIPQYKVAQYRIDLVIVLRNGIKIALECDGDTFHGTEQYKDDMIRQRELERCGWQFFRIRASMFYTNPCTSLYPLWELLKKNEEAEISSLPNMLSKTMKLISS
jgi:very-short-patch-repair endonuclease